MPSTWIFGYASLIWRPDFEYKEKILASVFGWNRRFWQKSTDHRGNKHTPGRVATLLPASEKETCWGVVYRVSGQVATEIFGQLDIREKQGYEKTQLDCHLLDGRRIHATCYIASKSNPHFLGPQSIEEIANVVEKACGESGSNKEYVFNLHLALQKLGVEDLHLSLLVEELRRRIPVL